jgi:hypothetical protein
VKQIVEYNVIAVYSTLELLKNVSAAIRDGFQPLGGTSCTTTRRGEVLFVQAVVRYGQPCSATSNQLPPC